MTTDKKHKPKNRGIEMAGGFFLYPLDAHNWELCRRNAEGKGRSVGRYYQHDTLQNAFAYVADLLLKEGMPSEETVTLDGFAERYGRMRDELVSAVRTPLDWHA